MSRKILKALTKSQKINAETERVKRRTLAIVRKSQTIDGAGADELISNDDIERNGFRWYCADTIPARMKKGEPIIINTATRAENGEHWITAFKNRDGVFVYDPLGPRNNRSNAKLIRDRLAKSGDVSFYPEINQGRKANICGWLALLVAGYLRKWPNADPVDLIKSRIHGDGTDEIIAAFGVKK